MGCFCYISAIDTSVQGLLYDVRLHYVVFKLAANFRDQLRSSSGCVVTLSVILPSLVPYSVVVPAGTVLRVGSHELGHDAVCSTVAYSDQ